MDDISDRPGDIEITPEMIEAAGRCLRTYLAGDAISYGESEMLAERVLRAVFCHPLCDNAPVHTPSEVVER
jgi:hypothetical protein